MQAVVYTEKGHFSKKVMMFILNYKFEEVLKKEKQRGQRSPEGVAGVE